MTGELTQNVVVQPPKSWCLSKLRKNVICGPVWVSESLLAAVWASESFAVELYMRLSQDFAPESLADAYFMSRSTRHVHTIV